MRGVAYIFFLMIFLFSGCEQGGEGEESPSSGEATINNTLIFDSAVQSYYLFGFSFSKAGEVSTLSASDCMTVGCSASVVNLQTSSYTNSFFLYGEYADSISAGEAFGNLVVTTVSSWEEWASPVEVNQIWIYRTRDMLYAKLLITSVIITEGDLVECSFRWVYQPDGTLIFPAE